MQSSLSLSDQNKLHLQLLDRVPQAIVVFDQEGTIRCWNSCAEKMFGVQNADAVGQPVLSLLNVIQPDESEETNTAPHAFSPQQSQRVNDQRSQLIVTVPTASVLNVEQEQWNAVFFRDVTSEIDNNRRLERAATTDSLSGLCNRRGFQESLEQNISGKLTLAIVDADEFKQINDTFGHEAGDAGIQLIADLLRASFPDAICLARLGGDEFGVVTTTVSGPDTNLSYEKFLLRIAKSKLGSMQFSFTVSAGIAISNVPGTSARELLTTADRALYAAKAAGRNAISVTQINV